MQYIAAGAQTNQINRHQTQNPGESITSADVSGNLGEQLMASSIVASRAALSNMLRIVRSHHLNTRSIVTASGSSGAVEQNDEELIKSVPVEDVQGLLDSGLKYVDVRTNEEFSAGRPSGAINIPYLVKHLEGMSLNPKFLEEVSTRFTKDDILLLGCKSGKRSLLAAFDLHSAGFRRVINVAGGYSSWVKNGLPTEQ